MKASQPWIKEVKYYKNGDSDYIIYVYSDGSWKDEYWFGPTNLCNDKEKHFQKSYDVSKLKTIKVLPQMFKGVVYFTMLELFD